MTSQDLADVMGQKKQPTHPGGIFGIWNEGMSELKSFLGKPEQQNFSTETLTKQVAHDGNNLTQAISGSVRSKNIPANQIDMYLVKWEEKLKEQRQYTAL